MDLDISSWISTNVFLFVAINPFCTLEFGFLFIFVQIVSLAFALGDASSLPHFTFVGFTRQSH